MYPSRGAMMGSGGVSDGYEGTKRPRMMDSNPYFAVSGGSALDGFALGSKRSRMMESSPFFGGFGASNLYQPYRGSFSEGSSFGGGGGGASGIFNFPVVRLRGLPFNCEDADIYKFFGDLEILDCLLVNKNGRFAGEAFVLFPSSMQAEMALQKDRQNMGRRYVEVFHCRKQDYYNAIAAEVNQGGFHFNQYRHNSPPLPHPRRSVEDQGQVEEYTDILKLRGLPYSATKRDIVEFFGEFGVIEDKVHIAFRPDGKATGEAYVEFSSAEVAKKAMCKDKMTIGSRYVELFPSTSEDIGRSKSRFRQ